MKIMVLNMHKCGKSGSIVPSLFFSHFIFIFIFWWALWPLLFPHMGQCSINNDHHTFNSKLRATMTLYGMPSVVYRGNDLAWHRHQWKHHASYLTIMQWQCRRGGTCHGGSCMAIYLGMTLKKP